MNYEVIQALLPSILILMTDTSKKPLAGTDVDPMMQDLREKTAKTWELAFEKSVLCP